MKNNKLYNVMFPFWMLIYMPPVILLAVPVNFAVDSLVLIVGAHFLLKDSISLKELWKKTILKVFLFGFLADFIAAALLLSGLFLESVLPFGDFYSRAVSFPLESPANFAVMLTAVLIAGALIYVFDCYFSFKKLDLASSEKKKLALCLAVLTAPWTFFIQLY